VKVLYVHDRPSGGAGESLYQLVEARHNKRTSIIVFGEAGFVGERFATLGLEPAPIYQKAHSWIVRRWQNHSVMSLFWRLLVSPAHLPLLMCLLRVARKHQVDLIHTNCIYLVEGAVAAKILGLPHIWQVRELVDLDYYQYILPKKTVVQCLQVLSDVILCNSDRLARGLIELGANYDRIRMIPNIVDEVKVDGDLRAHLGLCKDVRLVGTIGWIRSIKRIEDFVSLASKLSDLGEKVRFVIIGGWGGEVAYNTRIKQAIKNSPNRTNIIHTGVLKNAASYMASLDVLVCPCFAESFGRSVAEALAAGTPAIGVRECAVAEIIDHGRTGFLVNEGDVASMAEYTRLLLADTEKRNRFGELGKKTIQSRFSGNVLLPQFESLYRECVGTHYNNRN